MKMQPGISNARAAERKADKLDLTAALGVSGAFADHALGEHRARRGACADTVTKGAPPLQPGGRR
jgi:hypothetical protein